MVTIDDAIEFNPVIAGVAAQLIHEVNEIAMMNGGGFQRRWILA